ncbi:MAG: permease-like cell division protein FtsX [Clostridia bacterium]|nr:permease-like cell division protein FtsX [Clostridia bacterium]
MKRHYSIRFFLEQAFKGLTRNSVMSVASIAVLMSCLIVLGSFSLLILNINVNLDKIAELNEIMVYCDYELTEEQITEIEKSIKSLENVGKVSRITKDESLQIMKDESGEYADLYSDITAENNPLCDSFEIIYKDLDETAVFNLEAELRNIEGVRKINSVYKVAKTIDNLKSGVMLVFIWFLVILFVVSIFVIINTIKLAVYSRKNEITVMRYVGATNGFITYPFIFEGIIIGGAASALAFAIQSYIYTYVVKMAATDMQMISILTYKEVYPLLIVGFLAIGILTGVIGSVASLNKYLKS